jgi:hypothetical protein
MTNNLVKFTIFYNRQSFIKKILKIFLNKLKFKFYYEGGANQVVLNLIESLKKNKMKFNINPFFESDIAETCIVLSGKKELQRCINLKKKIVFHI